MHEHTHARTHTCAHLHTYTHLYTHLYTYPLIHIHTYTWTHSLIHSHSCTLTQAPHTYAHYTQTYSVTQAPHTYAHYTQTYSVTQAPPLCRMTSVKFIPWDLFSYHLKFHTHTHSLERHTFGIYSLIHSYSLTHSLTTTVQNDICKNSYFWDLFIIISFWNFSDILGFVPS